jgi:uncharacterized membrane protein
VASTAPAPPERPSRAPGLMYGVGFGGFVDGILLHQILQWHHMLSAVESHPPTEVDGLELNTLADGYFHAVTWCIVVGASVVTLALWQQGRLAPSWPFHLGGVLTGWGLFNLVEGLVDHQLLGVHHVRDDLGGPLSWDLGFLAVSLVLVLVGLAVQQRSLRPQGRSRPGGHRHRS